MDDSYHSDTDSEKYFLEESFQDAFLSKHIEDIIDIFYEFQQRFGYDPPFLHYLKAPRLTDLFVECASNKRPIFQTVPNNYVFDKFQEEYQNEIYISYSIINNFTANSTFDIKVKYSDWTYFCFNYSDVSEFKRRGLV